MISEFPFKGEVKRVTVDDLGEETFEEIFSGNVDIQHTSVEMGIVAQSANYAIFTDMPKDDDGKYYNPIRRGDVFNGEVYGEVIGGKVQNVQPSQLGKMTIYINRETW